MKRLLEPRSWRSLNAVVPCLLALLSWTAVPAGAQDCNSNGIADECDLDFDGDYDNDDANEFDNLPQGLARHPSLTSTGVHQPFGHQGLYPSSGMPIRWLTWALRVAWASDGR